MDIKTNLMLNDILQRLEVIDTLIQKEKTGTPSQLARKIGLSDRSVYEYLTLMKKLNSPIKFCPIRKSYYYDRKGRLVISFEEDN